LAGIDTLSRGASVVCNEIGDVQRALAGLTAVLTSYPTAHGVSDNSGR
jgi:hypothetical protein